jgi:hypothetical protein
MGDPDSNSAHDDPTFSMHEENVDTQENEQDAYYQQEQINFSSHYYQHHLVPTKATLYQQWNKEEHVHTPEKKWNLALGTPRYLVDLASPTGADTSPNTHTPLVFTPKQYESVHSKLFQTTAAAQSAYHHPLTPEKPRIVEVPIQDNSHLLKPTTACVSGSRPKLEEKPSIHKTSFKSSPGNAKVTAYLCFLGILA